MRRQTSAITALLACLSLSLPATAGGGANPAVEAAAARLLEQRMENTRPEDLKLLKSVQGKEIIVVRGSMDHIEDVLRAAGIRHTVVSPEQVAGLDLNARQIVMVNCPGNMPQGSVTRLERFVRAGGLLYTTDWALLNLVQKAFPGTIKYSGRPTGDHMTPVVVKKRHGNLMSDLLLREGTKPQWWLEGSSYPIEIVDKRRVEVLAESEQMRQLYGSAPVVARFRWEDGEVIHVVSHFYRQVSTQGPQVASGNAIDDVGGLSDADKAAYKASAGAGVSMSEVESSYAFQQMTSNIVVGKQRRNAELDKAYGWTAKDEVTVEGRRVKRGDRLKVLEKKGTKTRVRDDRGNEAWIDEAELTAR